MRRWRRWLRRGRRALLLLSKGKKERFLRTYSDIFAIEGDNVILIGNMDAAALADKVGYATSWEVFLALKSDEALSVLGLTNLNIAC